MNMKYFYFGGLMAVMVACQEQALPLETEKEMMPMRLEASIAQDASSARTVVNSDNGVSFSENDCIGLFVPWEATARKWTYCGSSWTSESSVYWKDKTGYYTFYAYYPCGSQPAASYTAVPMPDLSSQTGTITGLADYDFLVASKSLKYDDEEGKVSFTGENAFEHVLSRISFLIDRSAMDTNTELVSIQLSSTAFYTKCTYNFASGIITQDEGSMNTISSSIVPEQTTEILVNPVTNAAITVSLVYKINSEEITVSSQMDNLSIVAGTKYSMRITVQQGQLKLNSMTIAPWGEGAELPAVTL